MAQKKIKPIKQTEEQSAQATALTSLDVRTRGRFFEGFVTKKFPTRVVVEFERTVYVKKYQRFYKKKTRLHARLPQGFNLVVGDYIRIQECRPLSKIIHFMVVEKLRAAEQKQEKKL